MLAIWNFLSIKYQIEKSKHAQDNIFFNISEIPHILTSRYDTACKIIKKYLERDMNYCRHIIIKYWSDTEISRSSFSPAGIINLWHSKKLYNIIVVERGGSLRNEWACMITGTSKYRIVYPEDNFETAVQSYEKKIYIRKPLSTNKKMQ